MKESTDIWFIAYLMYKGVKVAKYTPLQRGKVKCFFELGDAEWQQHKLEFNNSEFIKFKGLIEQVKDLGF